MHPHLGGKFMGEADHGAVQIFGLCSRSRKVSLMGKRLGRSIQPPPVAVKRGPRRTPSASEADTAALGGPLPRSLPGRSKEAPRLRLATEAKSCEALAARV